MWKIQKFTLTEKIFRQLNSLVISIVNTLVSRNFWQNRVRVNFRYFHSALWSGKYLLENYSVKSYSIDYHYSISRNNFLIFSTLYICTYYQHLRFYVEPILYIYKN